MNQASMNNIVTKFENIQKNGKSQKAIPPSAHHSKQHGTPQKYGSLTN